MVGQCYCCGGYGPVTRMNGMYLCDYCWSELERDVNDEDEDYDEDE